MIVVSFLSSPYFWCCYASIEVLFHVLCRFHLVPRANQRTTPADYRDYLHHHRHKLLLRILARMERTCARSDRLFHEYLEEFLEKWFHQQDCHEEKEQTETQKEEAWDFCSTTSVSSNDDDDDDDVDDAEKRDTAARTTVVSSSITTTPDDGARPSKITRQNADEFLSWAFYGKHHVDLLQWELKELECMYGILRDRYHVVFLDSNEDNCEEESHNSGSTPGTTTNTSKTLKTTRRKRKARLLNLEDVSPWHRPLLVYVVTYGLNTLGGLVWRLCGYRRYRTSNGLTYWHASPRSNSNRTPHHPHRLPLLFFHGIAPGGLAVYIPLLWWGLGLCKQDRHVFLFENPPISCRLVFDSLTEEETVEGVTEALDVHLASSSKQQQGIALAGHSFGSCPLTWLLHSKQLRSRIRQLVLIDPVTILLSEPDVMNNFLYSRQMTTKNGTTDFDHDTSRESSNLSRLVEWWHRNRIHIVASSELCTEHYLRRHFAWYNSELWIDQIPSQVKVLVCLSEDDEIVHARKVLQEIQVHNELCRNDDGDDFASVDVLYWKGVGHAHCLLSNRDWKELRGRVEKHEASVLIGDKVKVS